MAGVARSAAARASVHQLRLHQGAFDYVYVHLDLSNPSELSREVFGVHDEVVGVLWELSERLRHSRNSSRFTAAWSRLSLPISARI